MNIHGLKLKLIPIKEKLRKGIRELGKSNYNKLIHRRSRIKYQINKLRQEREKKKTKFK